MADVSVIIPVLNAEKSIGRCVESVLASSFPADRMEVICVDNSSTDRTPEILRQFQPRIRVVAEQRRGPAAARNAGLRAATREFTAFTDADCFVDPHWLTNILKPLLNGAGAAGGRILARPEAGPVEMFGECIHDHSKAIEADRPPYLITMNMASRLSLLRKIGMFNENWIRMEDCEISYRLLAARAHIAYQGDAVVYHHNRDSVPKLAREGFLHGYYSPAFQRKHAPFASAYRSGLRAAPASQPSQTPPAEARLERWRLAAYWRVFLASKATGKFAGRLFNSRIE